MALATNTNARKGCDASSEEANIRCLLAIPSSSPWKRSSGSNTAAHPSSIRVAGAAAVMLLLLVLARVRHSCHRSSSTTAAALLASGILWTQKAIAAWGGGIIGGVVINIGSGSRLRTSLSRRE
ncbi:hypothetical protein GALMADRAFT_139786 [Galerina marginata CBS 339.88]|uniref:Uncharacterized protein n=1 Tax=Galerina marginata (strain CBS 339.88) TaxID=685588 RepID=A0A067TAM8_GALM3|nr:hypothetical protein GALMADRAFT_139786 [Galerina marginata CBS 339.88]